LPLSPFQRAKTEQLLATRLPCLGCHVINGRGGRLGPDLTDVGLRLSTGEIEDRITNPQALNPMSIMPRVPMPAGWRTSLAAYLARRSSMPGRMDASARSTGFAALNRIAATDGSALYSRLCSGCHGVFGNGDGPNAQYLLVAPARHADPVRLSTKTDDWLFDIITRGGYVMGRHPSMPPYGELLEPKAIRALVATVRQLCRCEGPPWSLDGQKAVAR
jgi:mono/diheme cytochrome c family protein